MEFSALDLDAEHLASGEGVGQVPSAGAVRRLEVIVAPHSRVDKSDGALDPGPASALE
jgi:hypothetical protein